MPKGIPCASVFIWYPNLELGHVGHASMYIGEYAIGAKYELALDPSDENPFHVMVREFEDALDLSGEHYNDNYVSWWPEEYTGLTGRQTAAPKLRLYQDVYEEDSQPHVVYTVYGLNVPAMRTKWKQIRDKEGATYQLVRKSCATIVIRVLEAGGALDRLSLPKSLWFGNRLYWTPKRLAQVCNQLRDKDLAVKRKAGNCPGKEGGVMGNLLLALGMR